MSPGVRIGVASAVASAAMLLVFVGSGAFDPVDLLFPGQRGNGAAVLADDFGPDAVPDRFSYDGQETYVIASTFPDIRAASDAGIPAFRIKRVFQPAIASVAPAANLTVGLMALLNVVGVGLAAGSLADLAARHGRDPRGGYAAAVFLAFSLIITTTEPLAFGLALTGLVLLERHRWLCATAAFALGGLTRETALVMALAGALVLVGAGRWRHAIGVLAGATLPLVLWSMWVGHRVPPDLHQSSKFLGVLNTPTPSLADATTCAAAIVLMVIGVWRWRDAPLLSLTALGFLGCCAFYIGDAFQFHALPRLSSAAMAIGAAGLLPRRPVTAGEPAPPPSTGAAPAPSGGGASAPRPATG